ncbi:MAG: nicotinate-nucleotide adenylyltransferase [Candidatus Limnocylindria bacterium]
MGRRRVTRIGVLGGTFDPPHVGHLWLGALAAEALGLDRVLFVPASTPPHKLDEPVTAAEHRLEMTRVAIGDDSAFELSAIELERDGPSYTVGLVPELRAMHPGADLFLVMAADSLETVETWRDPHRLLQMIEWVVGPRPGSALPDPAVLADRFGADASRIHLLTGPALDVSSTEIRRRVAAGRTIRYLVPRGVEELIAERRLYRR